MIFFAPHATAKQTTEAIRTIEITTMLELSVVGDSIAANATSATATPTIPTVY